MSLVNKTWNIEAKPILYSRWTYDDTRHPVMRVWKFLRTISENPKLSGLVKAVDIRQYQPDDRQATQSSCQIIPGKDRTWVVGMLRLTGLQNMESNIEMGLSMNTCRDLFALVLASLPNLETMSLVIGEVDGCLARVLNSAVLEDIDQPKSLQKLKEANLRTPQQ